MAPIHQFFQKLDAGEPQTVVVYGTSLTAAGAWTNALKQWFQMQFPGQVTFFNQASGGKNSQWGNRSLAEWVLPHEPDLIFIEFSYNDAIDDQMPVAEGWSNLHSMVDRLRETNPEIAIVLQIMNVGWDPSPDHRPFSRRPQLEAFNDNYRRYAARHSLPLLDHYPAWKNLKDHDPKTFRAYLPDGSHPTSSASLAVTWPAIESFLNQSYSAQRS